MKKARQKKTKKVARKKSGGKKARSKKIGKKKRVLATGKKKRTSKTVQRKRRKFTKPRAKVAAKAPPQFGTDHTWFFGAILLTAAALLLGLWMISSRNLGIKQFYKDQFGLSRNLSTVGERVDYWSEFVKKQARGSQNSFAEFAKYGPKIQDHAPLVPAKFDCTTYVETVGAFAKSKQSGDFFRHLLSIRYSDSETTYAKRNHFPTIDWIPNNVQAGHIEDVTERIAGKADVSSKTLEKTYKKSRWVRRQVRDGKLSRSLASGAGTDWDTPYRGAIRYIPLDDAKDAAKHFPNGAVMNVVRASWPRADVLISHQGFVIQKGNETFFRHAGNSGKIVTIPMERYLESQEGQKWPVVGVNLNVFR